MDVASRLVGGGWGQRVSPDFGGEAWRRGCEGGCGRGCERGRERERGGERVRDGGEVELALDALAEGGRSGGAAVGRLSSVCA